MIRRRRKRRKGISTFKAGLIAVILIALFTYGGFTKFANPFANPYTLHALVSGSNSLEPNSLVRIAGVNVGKVTSISSVGGKQMAEVSMNIGSNGLPIHQDATIWIRPRTFLEGNFFVDLYPGSPSAPVAKSGFTVPVQNTRDPVQLDQVLDSLQANTRTNLQTLLSQYGYAVDTASKSFNQTIQYWLPAYEYSSVVGHDLLGLEPHDLSNAIYEQGDVSAAINKNPPALESLISNFDTTADAFARQNVALQQAVAELPKTLAAATPAFNALNAAFPPLRQLAVDLIPGVQSAGPAIDDSLPFINQLRLLVQPSELRGLTNDLSHTVPALAKLTKNTIPLMKNEVRPVSNCVTQVIIPWSKLEISDPNFNGSNGFPQEPAYVEVLQILPGIAGESRTFDGNGPYIKLLVGGGTFTYSLQPGLFGTLLAPLTGVQPVPPAGDQRPPLEPNVPCETQAPISTLNTPMGAPPTQLSPSTSGGALKALESSAQEVLGGQLDNILKQTGSKLRVKGAVASLLGGSSSQ
jgi:phospholipid/cholesterol/gamma-HCH transport system substrate-binding protein